MQGATEVDPAAVGLVDADLGAVDRHGRGVEDVTEGEVGTVGGGPGRRQLHRRGVGAIPEEALRLTAPLMSSHDGRFPPSSAVTATAGWSVFVVVYSLTPGVQVWAWRLQVFSACGAPMPATTDERVVPLLSAAV